uniref:Uncharacterized protein n=1 Tax=Timema cristinae TaxID=61476 RepID=A0A7R9CV36_TIMCR|nr:unnamed protein product [Timema cristinae]
MSRNGRSISKLQRLMELVKYHMQRSHARIVSSLGADEFLPTIDPCHRQKAGRTPPPSSPPMAISQRTLSSCPGTAHKEALCQDYRTRNIPQAVARSILSRWREKGSLRALVTSSASIYTNLIESLCLCCQELKPDFVWGADLVTSSFIPIGLPIFNVQLKMDPEKVWYSTDPLNFEPELVGLFNFTIAQTHTVQQVHPFILEHLTFAEDLFLSSVGLEEMFVCDMRKRFVDGIRQAIIPLRAYAQEYYRHIELWELNVQEYVNKFKDEDHTAVELKEEVQFQLKMKVNLEVTLPEKIVIGPFIINVDPLKQFLVGKRKDMYIKLLDMFAERQRAKVEEEYDILDQFWYSLNQEDFDAKWEGLFYPLKIQAQIEATFLSLEEETEKFEKLQLGDESALLEKIDHLTVMVTRMANERDIDKTATTQDHCNGRGNTEFRGTFTGFKYMAIRERHVINCHICLRGAQYMTNYCTT